eukprot:TRINITY_DN1370_c2_g1_i1.p1 TRINITY_DN1370_c2_g1~~TRINITY_DN1370_c2_g1_i1.p1  ORF type:complete len:146 (+),score=44.20 TRINITY_DN1370_c2_g1_i1:90-527(+)
MAQQQQPQAVNPLPKERQEHYQKRMNAESSTLKELQTKIGKLQNKVQQLQLQKQENEMVSNEMDVMEEGAEVYKLIGPALVSQDVEDAKAIVTKRLEYINNEIKTVDKEIENVNKQHEKQKKAVVQVQEDFKSEIERMLKESSKQ